MAKKRMSIEVQGKRCKWSFTFDGDPRHLDDWRADGLEVNEILNVIPLWVPARLIRPWCLAQDLIYGGLWDRKKKRPD